MADADAIVVGAGPGGLMTALALAQRGAKVLVIEKKPLERIGKPLRVSVEKDIFSQLDLPEPEPPELISPPMSRELISPDGKSKLRLRKAPLVTIYMHAFIARLVGLCERAGVVFMLETAVTGPRIEGGRVAGVVGTTPDGRLLKLSALLSVDASGIVGVLRHNLGPEMGVTREIDPGDVAGAWQESREIDRQTVMDLLERNRIRPQVNVLRVGFRGPYSLLSVYVNLDEDRVEVTAGIGHDPSLPTARELVEAYTESHHWVGEPIMRGGGLIPVRRPLDSFVAPGFACVGDAACQAIPLHAGGVSSALSAGMLLGEVAAKALERGDVSREALWPYNVGYMEARGAAQANSDLFRRFLTTLTADEISELFSRRLINEQAVVGSLQGMALEVPPSAVAQAVVSLWKRPGLLGRLTRLSRSSTRVLDLYIGYPDTFEDESFEKWKRRVRAMFGKWKQP